MKPDQADEGADEARARLALLHVAAGFRSQPVPQRQQAIDYAVAFFGRNGDR